MANFIQVPQVRRFPMLANPTIVVTPRLVTPLPATSQGNSTTSLTERGVSDLYH